MFVDLNQETKIGFGTFHFPHHSAPNLQHGQLGFLGQLIGGVPKRCIKGDPKAPIIGNGTGARDAFLVQRSTQATGHAADHIRFLLTRVHRLARHLIGAASMHHVHAASSGTETAETGLRPSTTSSCRITRLANFNA